MTTLDRLTRSNGLSSPSTRLNVQPVSIGLPFVRIPPPLGRGLLRLNVQSTSIMLVPEASFLV
jgi:hypothetical protein